MTTLEGYVTLLIFLIVRLADVDERNNTAKAVVLAQTEYAFCLLSAALLTAFLSKLLLK
jgi:hypothetical protein